MEFSEIVGIATPLVFIVVGIVLIWLIIELVVTARHARRTMDEVKKQVEPTLVHVEQITAALAPTAAKIDPLVDRVSLTVDAANLEIMRVDKILEDVSEVTGTLSSTASAVDAIASAPMDLVNNVAGKVRGVFKQRGASAESVALGEERAQAACEEREAAERQRARKRRGAVERLERSRDAGSALRDEASASPDAALATSHGAAARDGYFTYGAKQQDAADGAASAAEPGDAQRAVVDGEGAADAPAVGGDGVENPADSPRA